mgnify:CR=1 FL=1
MKAKLAKATPSEKLEMARKLRLMTFRWAATENILFTAVILLLGAVVFWYAVAMFVPLTRLIHNLS